MTEQQNERTCLKRQTLLHQTESTRCCPRQNALVTRRQIKTLDKQQTPHPQTNLGLRNTALGNRILVQHSNTRTLPVEGFAHDNGRTMVHSVPTTVIRKDLQIPTVKHKISRYSKRLSVHPTQVILDLQEPPETRRWRKNLPIDLPVR
jgi:hypothetical protein